MYEERLLSEEDLTILQMRGLARAARREHLGNNMPKCPKCFTEQVQLVDWIHANAAWKCRECGLTFNFDPTRN